MSLDQATLDHCKAWIDYRCHDLRSEIGPLDEKSKVKDLTIDVAMKVLVHNTLVILRLELDHSDTPLRYPAATQRIFIDDAAMERLRNQGSTRFNGMEQPNHQDPANPPSMA